jgi:hypothetical protein
MNRVPFATSRGFVVLFLLAFAPPAVARERHRALEDDDDMRENRRMQGDAAYFFRASTSADRDARTQQLFSFAADTRGFLPLVAHRFGPAIAADLDLGTARPLAFTYGLHLYPVGFGYALGQLGSFVATAGAGLGGISGRLPFDLELPVAARLAIDITPRARFVLDGRAVWTADGRDHDSATLGEETRMGVGARFGRTWGESGFADAGGYFFRLERSERMGARYVGLALGYELGAAF